jgi:tripartite-type tricarboxylate transporter receptor subunit TctC
MIARADLPRIVARWSAATVAAAVAVLSPLVAHAQSPADFYKGKQIAMITAASPGGGYDQYARLIAQHMPRYIPGNPSIVVQNMVGAEGLRAANYIYNVAAKDGTVIGGLSRNTGLAQLYAFDSSGVQFDPRKFHWLGSPQQEIGLFIVHAKSGVKTAADLKSKDLSVSATAHNSPSAIYARMLNATYGTRLKPVSGYQGSQAALLALERFEVETHISGGSSAAFRARIEPWLKSGTAHIVMQMGMSRDSAYPDVPTVLDLLTIPSDRQLFEIGFIEQVAGRPFVMPPGTPPDRVAVMRAAFDATMKDSDFLAHSRREKVEISPVDGATINALLDKAYAAPPEVIAKLRAFAK